MTPERNPDALKAWIGRSETVRDPIGTTPAATLDRALVELGAPLPYVWQWLRAAEAI